MLISSTSLAPLRWSTSTSLILAAMYINEACKGKTITNIVLRNSPYRNMNKYLGPKGINESAVTADGAFPSLSRGAGRQGGDRMEIR